VFSGTATFTDSVISVAGIGVPTGWTANRSGVAVGASATPLEVLTVTGYNNYLVTVSGTMQFNTTGPFQVYISFNGTQVGQASVYPTLSAGADAFSVSIIVGGSGLGSQAITAIAGYIFTGSGTASVNLNAIGLA
jgi:hypothetical protein